MSFIYLISNGQNTKIGFAKDVYSRLRQLRCASSASLTVLGVMPGTMDDERRIHARFASKRLSGEWFSLSSEDIGDLEREGFIPFVPRRGQGHGAESLDVRNSGKEIGLKECLIFYLKLQHPRLTAKRISEDTLISENTVQSWLKGQSSPSIEAFLTMLRVYGPSMIRAIWMNQKIPSWLELAVISTEIDDEIAALKALDTSVAEMRDRLKTLQGEVTKDRRSVIGDL